MSKVRASGRTAILAVVAVAVAGSIVAVAAASTIVHKSFTIPLDKPVAHTVSCPDGKRPASGGFTLSQHVTSVETRGSGPANRKWRVQVLNDEHDKGSGTVIALCAKDKGLVVRSKAVRTAPTDTDVQLTVHCPKGSMAIGGGGKAGSGAGANQLGEFPTNAGKAWGTRWRLAGAEAVSLKAYAICDRRIRGYNIVEASGTFQPKRIFFGPATAVAKCEGTDKLAGGGYFRLDPLTFFTRVGPKGQGWEASANVSSASDPPILSFAICGK